jgi:hypothetical protein
MADQIEVPKITSYALVKPPVDNASVSKLVMFVLAFPGEGTTATGQGHVHTQIITRSS